MVSVFVSLVHSGRLEGACLLVRAGRGAAPISRALLGEVRPPAGAAGRPPEARRNLPGGPPDSDFVFPIHVCVNICSKCAPRPLVSPSCSLVAGWLG